MNRMPLPVSHTRARFYQLQRVTFWVLIAVAFLNGFTIGGCIMTKSCTRAHERAEGTP